MAIPITLGVWIRVSVKSFLAGDLSLETALLLGVIGGRLSEDSAERWSRCPPCCTASGRACH